jgi:hypothetical protein
MVNQLLLLELNEVNFDFVEAYIAQGRLPVMGALIKRHGISRTTSEESYERLEPWIQWVTAHTGQSFEEHRVFRLGDIVRHDIPQIWELLEAEGLRVGAISPMNAKHRARAPAFFVPDPWTPTEVTGGATLRRLHSALAQVVNDNAQAKISLLSLTALLLGVVRYARPANYVRYLQLGLSSWRSPWRKAVFLDMLLTDIFIREVRHTKPHFATLFLNAAAHIQHHYLFSSSAYSGMRRNPEWYVAKGVDPVLEVYSHYDRFLGQVARKFPDARLMLATGLHQVPHDEPTFYWRLKDHAKFLQLLGLQFAGVEPRMSRDFLVICSTSEEASRNASLLQSVAHEDGTLLFEVENRGRDLFVMLSYAREIHLETRFVLGGRTYEGLYEHVVFVALKNGEHNGLGYFVDTGEASSQPTFPLKDMPRRIMDALEVGGRHVDGSV